MLPQGGISLKDVHHHRQSSLHDRERKRSSNSKREGQPRPLLMSPHHPSVCSIHYSTSMHRAYEYCDKIYQLTQGIIIMTECFKNSWQKLMLTTYFFTAMLDLHLAIGNETKMFWGQQKNHKARQLAPILDDEEKWCFGLLGWHHLTPTWPQLNNPKYKNNSVTW